MDTNNPMHVRKPIIIALVVILSPIVAFLAITIIWKLFAFFFFHQSLF